MKKLLYILGATLLLTACTQNTVEESSQETAIESPVETVEETNPDEITETIENPDILRPDAKNKLNDYSLIGYVAFKPGEEIFKNLVLTKISDANLYELTEKAINTLNTSDTSYFYQTMDTNIKSVGLVNSSQETSDENLDMTLSSITAVNANVAEKFAADIYKVYQGSDEKIYIESSSNRIDMSDAMNKFKLDFTHEAEIESLSDPEAITKINTSLEINTILSNGHDYALAKQYVDDKKEELVHEDKIEADDSTETNITLVEDSTYVEVEFFKDDQLVDTKVLTLIDSGDGEPYFETMHLYSDTGNYFLNIINLNFE